MVIVKGNSSLLSILTIFIVTNLQDLHSFLEPMDQPSVKILSVYTAVVDLIFEFQKLSCIKPVFLCVHVVFKFGIVSRFMYNYKTVLLITLITVS